MKHRFKILMTTAFILTSAAALAQDAGFEPGDTGSGQPGDGGRPTITVQFDDRDQFIPPERLPIQDTYIKEALTITAEQARQELTAIAITPDGQAEVLPPDDATVQFLLESLQSLEIDDAVLTDLEATVEPGSEGDNEAADAFASESVNAESVIGTDTRVRINGTTSYPFRTMGRIDIGCTGTLIGPRHVLTAGHCVYNIDNDKWYSSLSFSPGQNGAVRPYGKIGWKRAISVRGWTQDHKRNYDYAMIVLDSDVGSTVGWLGYGWRKPMPDYNVNINGYPGDKPFGTMWHAYCNLGPKTTYRLYYPCDTYKGMSGSGVYVYKSSDQSRIIYGVHAYGVNYTGLNGATRIRKAVFENLKKWKATY